MEVIVLLGWYTVCDIKASPVTTYMNIAVHMTAADDVFGGDLCCRLVWD